MVFCFHHVGSGNWTQVLRLRGHLIDPTVVLLLNKPHKARCSSAFVGLWFYPQVRRERRNALQPIRHRAQELPWEHSTWLLPVPPSLCLSFLFRSLGLIVSVKWGDRWKDPVLSTHHLSLSLLAQALWDTSLLHCHLWTGSNTSID